MTSFFVSVIIPTFNRAQLLDCTIRSFLAQDYPHDRFEIIVVDNNSTDNTRRVVDSFSGYGIPVRYHHEPRQGVHYARNSAAVMSQGEILYFTDDDMVATSSLLTEIIKVFDFDSRIACVTGKVLPRFITTPPEWVQRTLVNALLSLTPEIKDEELLISRTCSIYSCHEAVKRIPFFNSGGFNPENTGGNWIGDGETGLYFKMREQGCLFAYTAASVIYHVIPPERMTLKYLVKRYVNQGNSDSCTHYRFHKDRSAIVKGMVRMNTFGFARMVVETGMKIAMGIESWHFIIGKIAYIMSRNRYDVRLLIDEKFRLMIERDDWIGDD